MVGLISVPHVSNNESINNDLRDDAMDRGTQFDECMLDIYRRAKDECDCVATRFLQMVVERGGVEAAHDLLASSEWSDGLTKLWECGRLDLTVETLVLREEFEPLFSEEERVVARRRLDEVSEQSAER